MFALDDHGERCVRAERRDVDVSQMRRAKSARGAASPHDDARFFFFYSYILPFLRSLHADIRTVTACRLYAAYLHVYECCLTPACLTELPPLTDLCHFMRKSDESRSHEPRAMPRLELMRQRQRVVRKGAKWSPSQMRHPRCGAVSLPARASPVSAMRAKEVAIAPPQRTRPKI